eukprot:3403696-Rhodomonas_salina.1
MTPGSSSTNAQRHAATCMSGRRWGGGRGKDTVKWPGGNVTTGVTAPEFMSKTGIMMVVMSTTWFRRTRSFYSRWTSSIVPEKQHMLPQRDYIPGNESR